MVRLCIRAILQCFLLLWMGTRCFCLGLREPSIFSIVITEADRFSFRHARNLVSSIQSLQQNQLVVIYNVGMTKRQVDRVHSWENVVAISGFSSSKSLVLKDAVERFGRIIYIPPGIILKGTLEPVEFVLSKSGYLFFANNQEVSTATEFCGWASLPKNRVVGLIRGFQSFMKPCEWHVNASIPLSRHQEDFKMPHSMAYALPPIENVFATSHRSISFGQIHTARGIAVVIPFARFMLNDLLHKIEEWHLPEWAPCNQNKTAHLWCVLC